MFCESKREVQPTICQKVIPSVKSNTYTQNESLSVQQQTYTALCWEELNKVSAHNRCYEAYKK